MYLKRKLNRRLTQWQYRLAASYLAKASPEQLLGAGEKKLLKIFKQLAATVPAYQDILSKKKVYAQQVRSLSDFQDMVPIVDKQTLFHNYDLRSLCVKGSLDDIRGFFCSSGSSGLHSFGVETWEAAQTAGSDIEFLLDQYFGINKKKTLLINCLPMGVKVPTRYLQIADTSVRADVVLALINKLSGDFEQFILIGESPFLKKVVDEGDDEGFDWKDFRIHLITGGEFIPENYRSYMAKQLGIDFDKPSSGMIAVNMGLSELSLSLFRESPETIRIRRKAFNNRKLRNDLSLNEAACYCPVIMQFFPTQVFVETLSNNAGWPQLVVTLLDKKMKLPLIRYNTEDMGRCVSYREMASLLAKHGLDQLSPKFKLPFVLVSGKYQPICMPDNSVITPNLVKEAIYHDFDIANKLTGNFFIQQETNPMEVWVQLRKGYPVLPQIESGLVDASRLYCSHELNIKTVPYDQFPFGMMLNYQQKFKYA